MRTITITYNPRNRAVSTVLEGWIASNIVKTNPSPSNDPYFADPRNMAELERRMADKTPGKVFQSAVDAIAYFESL